MSTCNVCGETIKWKKIDTSFGVKNRPYDPDGSEHWQTHPECHPRASGRPRASSSGGSGTGSARTDATLDWIVSALKAIADQQGVELPDTEQRRAAHHTDPSDHSDEDDENIPF